MSDDEIIAVVQAHKKGRLIEHRTKGLLDWHVCAYPQWNFKEFEYRVASKPVATATKLQPREWTLYFYNGVLTHICPTTLNYETIHVREVIEEDKKSTVQRMMEYATGFKND